MNDITIEVEQPYAIEWSPKDKEKWQFKTTGNDEQNMRQLMFSLKLNEKRHIKYRLVKINDENRKIIG